MAARTTAAPSHARAESRSSSQIAATSAATSASDARRIDARTGLIHCCAITCTENAMPGTEDAREDEDPPERRHLAGLRPCGHRDRRRQHRRRRHLGEREGRGGVPVDEHVDGDDVTREGGRAREHQQISGAEAAAADRQEAEADQGERETRHVDPVGRVPADQRGAGRGEDDVEHRDERRVRGARVVDADRLEQVARGHQAAEEQPRRGRGRASTRRAEGARWSGRRRWRGGPARGSTPRTSTARRRGAPPWRRGTSRPR